MIGVLYWLPNTKPPKPEEQPMLPMASGETHQTTDDGFSIDSLLTEAISTLPEHASEDYKALQDKLGGADDKSLIYNNIAELMLEHKQYAAAAHFFTEKAKLDNSEKSLNFAGRFNLDLLHNAETAPVRAWAAQNAIANFEQSLKVNPDNDTVKMALASAYVDGTSQPMQGIQLLLGITRENPDNIPANLMLGQLSIRSGQYDKAQSRFEKVIELEPENTEALYFLAEVYKNKGDKQKAIELLEKCKKIINDPKFSNDVDNYIKSF